MNENEKLGYANRGIPVVGVGATRDGKPIDPLTGADLIVQNQDPFFHDCNTECIELELLLGKKHEDYGNGNIAKEGVPGILTRLTDKLERLRVLQANGKDPSFKAEAVRDTWLDVAGYGIIGLMVTDGKWAKDPAPKEASHPPFVYIAGPIDLTNASMMANRVADAVKGAGGTFYSPHNAFGWSGTKEAGAKLREINELALKSADAVIAIIPEGIQTIGTIMEITQAQIWGKTVVVLTDIDRPSAYLESFNLVHFNGYEATHRDGYPIDFPEAINKAISKVFNGR